MAGRRWQWALVLAMALPVQMIRAQSGPTTAFLDRVKAYLALRQKFEAEVPSLPKQATPEQIDQHQRALAELIRTSRAGAKSGDLFGADMIAEIKLALKPVFAGAEGAKRRSQILEEYPGPTPVTVNGQYPDRVPLSNMPAPVLGALPKLPDEIEYRFVGDQLILLDSRAHLVIDFIRNALPGA